MKRIFGLLLVLGVTAAGCGGDAPRREDDGGGIAALEEAEREKDGRPAPTRDTKKGTAKPRRVGTGEGTKKNRVTKVEANSRSEPVEPSTGGGANTGSSRRRSVAAAPIPSGTYQYATDGHMTISGSTSELPDRTTLTAQAPEGGEQRQLRDLRDREGNGTLTETRLLYRPEGVFVTYVKVTARFPGGLTDVREFKPAKPELVAPTNGAPGFARSFSMQGSGTRADVTVKAVRHENMNVGTSPVKALVVETKTTFSGSLEGEQNSVSWFWPKHVLVLKEEVQTDVRNGPIRLRSNYDAVLTRLP